MRRRIVQLEQLCEQQESALNITKKKFFDLQKEKSEQCDTIYLLREEISELQNEISGLRDTSEIHTRIAKHQISQMAKDLENLKAPRCTNSSHTQTQGPTLSVSPTHLENIPPLLQFRPIFIEQVRSISVPANEPASAADESPSPKPPVAEPPPQVHTISAISISTTDTEPASDDQSVPVSSTDPVSSPQPPPPSKTASPIVSQTQTCHSPKYQPPHKRKNFRSRKYSTYGLLHGPSKKQGNFHSKPQPTNFLTDNQGRRYHYTPQRLVKPQNTRVGADGLGDLVTAISYSVLRWLAPC